MECREINRILDENRLATLSAAERAHVDAHLAVCDNCAGSYRVHEILADETFAGARAGLLHQITDRLSHAAPAGRRAAPVASWPAIGGLLAAAALIVSIAVFLASSGSFDEPLPSVASEAPSADEFSSPSFTGQFAEGEDYLSISGAVPLSAFGERMSAWIFFMWSCLHCYEFEALLSEWVPLQDQRDVDVIRVPVQWNALARLHARAFYTAEALGIPDQIGPAFFDAIHVDGNSLDTRAEVEWLFSRAGISREQFAAAFDSPAVQDRLEAADRISSRFQIDAVPAVVVDGVYKTTAGSFEETLEVVDELVATARARELGSSPAVSDVADLAASRPAACGSEQLMTLDARIELAHHRLADLLQGYGTSHPDVLAARAALATAERRRGDLLAGISDDCI